ncbi:MAG: hypothetical protein U9N42_01220 [Campylobacterota bacterium]|nr:hypothetical protein [Campylobacterota bacterium]
MSNLKDVKPLFEWAVLNGDSKIIDRILVKTLPQLVKSGCELTTSSIENSSKVDVPSELYETIKLVTEELVGSSFNK